MRGKKCSTIMKTMFLKIHVSNLFFPDRYLTGHITTGGVDYQTSCSCSCSLEALVVGGPGSEIFLYNFVITDSDFFRTPISCSISSNFSAKQKKRLNNF